MTNKHSALVVGGGIAGLQASLDLAQNKVEVYLVEKQPRLGGLSPLLSNLFPTLQNAEEAVKPLIERVVSHPNVKLLPYARIKTVDGSIGNFTVQVSMQPRFVVEERCTLCGDCEKVCPVSIPKDYEMGLATRKAIYLPAPFPVPRKYLIDRENCLRFKSRSCNACREACSENAVDYNLALIEQELLTDFVVLATGFRQYDPTKIGQYRHGVYKNVITGLEYERMCSKNGPTQGKVLRVDNGEKPRSVVFILCAGSRDEKHLQYCCNLGCLNAIKHALLLKEQYGGDVDAYVCYIDVRAVTKWGEQFYNKVRGMGVEFVHGQPSEVREFPSKVLTVDVYDQSTSKLLSITADLIVLEMGLQPQTDLHKIFGLNLDKDLFFVERNPQLGMNETSIQGIFLAGAVQQPMRTNETVMHASSAALRVLSSSQ